VERGYWCRSDSGSDYAFPDCGSVGGGFFDAIRETPAAAAAFEIVEHSAFGSSLFGVGSGRDNEYVASALLYHTVAADLPD